MCRLSETAVVCYLMEVHFNADTFGPLATTFTVFLNTPNGCFRIKAHDQQISGDSLGSTCQLLLVYDLMVFCVGILILQR